MLPDKGHASPYAKDWGGHHNPDYISPEEQGYAEIREADARAYRLKIDHQKDLVRESAARIAELEARVRELEGATAEAYRERTKVVAALASMALATGFTVGIKPTAIPGWDADWHGCVWIETPWGQMSWHYHDSDAWMFQSLPDYKGEWDGHSTQEKYWRLWRLTQDMPERAALKK